MAGVCFLSPSTALQIQTSCCLGKITGAQDDFITKVVSCLERKLSEMSEARVFPIHKNRCWPPLGSWILDKMNQYSASPSLPMSCRQAGSRELPSTCTDLMSVWPYGLIICSQILMCPPTDPRILPIFCKTKERLLGEICSFWGCLNTDLT